MRTERQPGVGSSRLVADMAKPAAIKPSGRSAATIPCFFDAGLPEPKVLWESVVMGSKDDIWLRSFILAYKTFLPLMQKFGTVNPRVGDPETLGQRLVSEAVARRAQSVTGPFASACAVKG
jgi:hypothetical protein